MPDIKPFKAILYDKARVNPGEVVAPPYDVISTVQQSELYARHPNNIVRLILNNESNPYAAAGREYAQWRDEKILVADSRPSIYVVAQSFRDLESRAIERVGFIVACKLEDFGKGSIYPHEKTHSGPREDRFRLFQATNSMFSQIFGLYSDPGRSLDSAIRSVMNGEPWNDIDFDGVRNRMWRLTDERHIILIAEFMKGQKVLIADGHHRYETALVYRDSRRLKNPDHSGKEPYNFVPMFLTNMSDPGLVIFPTHRTVHSMKDFSPENLLKSCARYFTITRIMDEPKLLKELRSHPMHTFGVAFSGGAGFHLMSANAEALHVLKQTLPPALAELDVTLLHTLILKDILGMTDEEQEKKLYLDYVKEAKHALDGVRSGKSQAAFLLNPTHIEQVRAVASSGMVMPQKSTFFFPKLLSGLVIYSFDDLP